MSSDASIACNGRSDDFFERRDADSVKGIFSMINGFTNHSNFHSPATKAMMLCLRTAPTVLAFRLPIPLVRRLLDLLLGDLFKGLKSFSTSMIPPFPQCLYTNYTAHDSPFRLTLHMLFSMDFFPGK